MYQERYKIRSEQEERNNHFLDKKSYVFKKMILTNLKYKFNAVLIRITIGWGWRTD